MPPKTARKSVGAGRRGGRTRGTAKAAAAQPDPVPEESVKQVEGEDPVEVKEEELPVVVKNDEAVKVEEVNEEKMENVEEKSVADNGIDCSKRENNDVKDSEESEKDERLDLEESEPEEYVGDDYDEKENENADDIQEDVENEEIENNDINEEEIDEEDQTEELEPEDEDDQEQEHDLEKHADEDEQEHDDVFKERRKRKEFEIFVGGLDKDATEDDLRKVFSKVGEIVELRLMMNNQTKKNKGFAFIRFATVEQAKRACVDLKSLVINGKECGVTPSEDSDTLFLGNICKTWTKEALKEKLKKYGIDNVEDLTLIEDKNHDGTNRGFAFLEFSSRSDAMDAFKRLQKRDITFGVDRPAKVSFADAFIQPGDEIMAQVKTVFVDGLPVSWDEARVKDLVKKYGNVEKIELARNMPSARRKDYGFITFGTHDAAVTCAKNINNEEIGEGDNKVKIRARLSRPLTRPKGKYATRGDFRPSHPARGSFRTPWARPPPRHLPPRGLRRVPGRLPPVVDRPPRRPVDLRERRPIMARPPRGRPVAPLPRSYDRRPPVPSHAKHSLKRDYNRREELPPRSRPVMEYGPPPRSTSERSSSYRDSYPARGPASERSSSYRDSYPTRGPAYVDLPRESTHSSSSRRSSYTEGGGYSPTFERPPPSYHERPPPTYHERRPRAYDHVSGSKRPYAALDDVPPRYADTEVRHSRVRMDYDMGGDSSQYGDAYSDRVGRSNIGYGSSRSSMSGEDSHGLYSSSSRQGMSYGGGSYSGGDGGGMYGGDYISRGSGDVGGRSYSSSMYSSRSSLGGSGGGGYMGSGGSGSGSYY